MEIPNDVLRGDGFEVWIAVDGVPCTQYDMQYEEADAVAGPQVSCWIASKANKPFSINIKKEEDDSDYRATIYLDEQVVSNSVFRKTMTGTQTISAVWVSDDETKGFTFAPLESTDDDAYLDNPPLRNVGNIWVVMTRGKRGEFIPAGRERVLADVGKVHERSKNGLSHRVKYGPPEKSAIKRTCIQYDVVSKPVTFLFKYRSLDMLQATGIAPRPQPEPHNKENDVIDEVKREEIINVDSDEEKERELLAQLESVRNRKRAKRDNELPKKKVKAEPNPQFVPGDVIDLTI